MEIEERRRDGNLNPTYRPSTIIEWAGGRGFGQETRIEDHISISRSTINNQSIKPSTMQIEQVSESVRQYVNKSIGRFVRWETLNAEHRRERGV